MKKLFLGLFVSTLLTPLLIFAQPTRYVKLGINYSSFRTEGGKSAPGLTFGVGKDFYPIRSFSGFWGVGVDYVRKKVTLENKTWPTARDPKNSNVSIGDIFVDIGFFEIPVNVGYFLFVKKYIVLKSSVGASLSIPIQLNTFIKNSRTIFLDPDEKGKYEFDYLHWDDVSINMSTNIRMRFDFYYHSIGLLIQFQKALGKTKSSRSLSIEDKLDTVQITLAYSF